MEKDQEFVLNTVRYLVENPDDVEVDRKIDEMGVLLTLKVNPADMGKIIGKEGRTAKAIRTLLRVIGARMDARVNLKIDEPEGSTYVRPTPAAAATDDAATTTAAAPVSDDYAAPASDDSATTATDDSDDDFDPLATSKSLYSEDGSPTEPAADADGTGNSDEDANATSIL